MNERLSHYDELPDDDEMHPELRWDSDPEQPEWSSLEPPAETLIHERTGTQVDIYRREENNPSHSVQAKLGGYDDDAVVQPDEPGQMVSAITAVVSQGEPTLPLARGIAMAYMMGWMHRTHHADGIRDLEG